MKSGLIQYALKVKKKYKLIHSIMLVTFNHYKPFGDGGHTRVYFRKRIRNRVQHIQLEPLDARAVRALKKRSV